MYVHILSPVLPTFLKLENIEEFYWVLKKLECISFDSLREFLNLRKLKDADIKWKKDITFILFEGYYYPRDYIKKLTELYFEFKKRQKKEKNH